MQISITSRLPKVPDNACQIVFVHSDSKLKGTARKIDTECNGLIQQLFDAKDFNGEPGETLLLHGVSEDHAARILLVGLGERAVLDAERWRKSCARAAEALSKTPAETLISDALATVDIDNSDKAVMAEHLVREIASAQYQFSLHQKLDQLQSLADATPDGEGDEQPHATTESANDAPHRKGLSDSAIIGRLCDDSATPKTLILSTERKQLDVISEAADAALATAYGMATARDLGNLAPNYCTPSFLANLAERMAAQHNHLTTDILDEATMHTLGMNALLSVSAGSAQPARLIVMNYKGRKRAGSPIVLVGKGITFDTGGISIKPSSGMDEMKYDMCGAASVFGVIDSLCRLNADVNVIGVVAAAENMPGGKATRPGDVVTSLSGKTIEILNTDAEGRLVLADALSYCEQFKPASVVDIATLTGACIVALGHETSAVMGNHQPTIAALQAAGDRSGDRTWPLPLNEDYRQLLKSNFADIANIGGKGAGAITAGCFLSHFTESLHWAHLDIAGVAWKSGEHKGATGRPVPLLMSYIYNRSNVKAQPRADDAY